MARHNKKKSQRRSPSPEPPSEKPDFLRGYVSDDCIYLLGGEDAGNTDKPLILPNDAINYVLLHEKRGKEYIYKVGISDGVTLFVRNNQEPIDFGEMIFPSELPDHDEDPWDPRHD